MHTAKILDHGHGPKDQLQEPYIQAERMADWNGTHLLRDPRCSARRPPVPQSEVWSSQAAEHCQPLHTQSLHSHR